MIGKLKGILEETHSEYIIVDVNGVGYLVFCSSNTIAEYKTGNEVNLLIETVVKEDDINLYGFRREIEKEAFKQLTKIKGVSAKMALNILSSLTPDKLFLAINSGDKQAFKGISGVGTKLASRIITELQGSDSNPNYSLSPEYDNQSTNRDDSTSKLEEHSIYNDSIEALVSLGISRSEAHSKVSRLLRDNSELSIDSIIKQALKM
jgi:Holliday junction DNA helicase RuvA